MDIRTNTQFGKSSVVAVVEDSDQEHILLVKVCRYPTGSTDWELPAGGVETDETVIEAAQREILEETGYESINHEQVCTYHPLPGSANKLAYVCPSSLSEKSGFSKQGFVVKFGHDQKIQNAKL